VSLAHQWNRNLLSCEKLIQVAFATGSFDEGYKKKVKNHYEKF
jgi:hypothetical protein